MKELKYPRSFPNEEEEIFLKLVISNDDGFPQMWNKWRQEVVFDKIDHATFKLLPLLYLRLKNFNFPADDVINRIKGVYKLSWYKNQLIIDAVSNIISILNKENIPVVLLKGIPLLENVYKDRGARSLGDGDILIDSKYVEKVKNLMINNGWQYLYQSSFSINRTKNPLANKIIKEITFTNDKDVEIDIHWALFIFLFNENKEHPMNYEEVLKYTKDCELKGNKYKALCPEDMIIHIIVHGAEQNIERTFRWVVDTISIIKKLEIDWDFLIERIKKFEVEVELNIAFSYILEKFQVSIPQSFMKELLELPLNKKKIKDYYRITDTKSSFFFGRLPDLWFGYWHYNKKGNIFTSWYYFIDYICNYWGIDKKRKLPAFIFEKYKERIKFLLNR